MMTEASVQVGGLPAASQSPALQVVTGAKSIDKKTTEVDGAKLIGKKATEVDQVEGLPAASQSPALQAVTGAKYMDEKTTEVDGAKSIGKKTTEVDQVGGLPAASQSPALQVVTGAKSIDKKTTEVDGAKSIGKTTSKVDGANSIGKKTTEVDLLTLFGNHDMDVELSEALARLVSFEEHEELRRALPLWRVMQCGAVLLGDAKGTQATYDLSVVVERIGSFISHNWVVSRTAKYIAMCFHFNFRIASITYGSFSIFLFALSITGQVPRLLDRVYDDDYGLLARILCPIVFFIVFFLYRDIAGSLRFPGRSVFLDKACIHQVDKTIQRKSIEKLGAYLCCSDEMVVLYSDLYLVKLWTVFEVASFLAVSSVDKMKVVPVYLAKLYVVLICYLSSTTILIMILRCYSDLYDLVYILYGVGGLGYMYVLRQWAREVAAIKHRLRYFTVHDCMCFSENDRSMVQEGIITLLKARRVVSKNATEEETLQAFDKAVRQELPGAFTAVVRWCSFTYSQYVVAGFTNHGTYPVDSSVAWTDPDRHRFVICSWLKNLFWITAVWPCFLVVSEVVASRGLLWSGCKGGVYVTFGFVLFVVVPMVLVNEALRALETAANSSDVAVGAQVALIPAGVLAGVIVSAGRCPKRLSGRSRKPPDACLEKIVKPTGQQVDVNESPQAAACTDADAVWRGEVHVAFA